MAPSPSPDRPAAPSMKGSSPADTVLTPREPPEPAEPFDPADPDTVRATSTRALGAWSDTLGRAGSRAVQILLIAVVVAGAVWLLLQVKVVVLPVLLALILASAVSPLVRWLVRKGWPDLLATLAVLLGIILLIGAIVAGIVLAISNEWGALASSAQEGWDQLQSWLSSSPVPIDTSTIDQALSQAADYVTSGEFLRSVAGGAFTGISAATQFLTGLVLGIIILFFFLKDGPRMWNFVLRWFRGETRAKVAESVDRSAGVLGGYLRGIAIIATVDAVLIGIGLAILGVPLALPLAVLMFVAAFIPIVGAIVAGFIAALVALVTNGLVVALIVVAIVVVVNQVEGDLLQPVVMGRTLSLHALVVLLALTIGTIVGGIFGAILAVPYVAVAWAVIQVWTDKYQAGDDPVLGADPIEPQGRVGAKATMAERWKYHRMRLQSRHGLRLGATEQKAAEEEGDAEDITRS